MRWKKLKFILNYLADNELYTGTDADFSGTDPIIYREPLQTDQFDSLSLNGELFNHNNLSQSSLACVIDNNRLIFPHSILISAPNFVGSLTSGDFVYFFFRETAVEFTNCGKVKALNLIFN